MARPINIKKLLNQTSWTGKELGRLLVADGIILHMNYIYSEGENRQGLVSWSDLQYMVSTLDPIEHEIYDGYVLIQKWVNNALQMVQGQEQQALLYFERLFLTLHNAIAAEDVYAYIEQLPLIMTKKQYKDFTANKKHDGRATQNGIAILEPSTIESCMRIDKKTGYYKAPDGIDIIKELSLEGFYTENEKYAINIELFELTKEVFVASLHFVKGFNTVIDLMTSFYGIEELQLIKYDTVEVHEKRVEEFNITLAQFAEQISNSDYGSEELKEKKLKALDLFPINLGKTDISQKRITATKKNFKGFKAFKEQDLNPIITLCRYLDEEGRGIERYMQK